MAEWKSKLALPAQRALDSIKVINVNDLSRHTYFEIENLHGIGKSAISIIEKEMEFNDVVFLDEDKSTEVDEYINTFDGKEKERLEEMRLIIRKKLPKAKEKMAYGMPTYYYKENIVHFAGFKKHIGFFPIPNGIASFEEDLKGFNKSKGGIQFPIEKTMPKQIIEKIVEYRMKEIINRNRKEES